MKDQHTKIKGYRDLSAFEIDMINAAKKMAADVGDLVDTLESARDTDKRWVAIAKTDLQKGFMSLVRSIAQPESF